MPGVASQQLFNIPVIAERTNNIIVPLFDPPYSIDNILSNDFTKSSPWPHLLQDYRQASNGAMTYERSQVLRPFGVDTLQWGNPAGIASGSAAAGYYADKDFITSGEVSPKGVWHPNNVLALGAGIQTIGKNSGLYNFSAFGGFPVYRGFSSAIMWLRTIANDWNFAQVQFIMDLLALDLGGNDCDIWIPMPLVSGVNFLPGFGVEQNFPCFRSPITANVENYVNAFSNGVGKNIYACQTNTPVVGSSLWLLNALNLSSMAISAMTFDDNNITTLVNAGNYNLQGTNFGWLLTWAKGTYELIKGQNAQIILLAVSIDPQTNQLRNPFYAPVVLRPNTAKTNKAVSSAGASVKIDPNGIFYYRGILTGSDPTFVGNSQGLDLSIPGVPVDMSKANGNLSIPSFCPCSPVAVHVGGA